MDEKHHFLEEKEEYYPDEIAECLEKELENIEISKDRVAVFNELAYTAYEGGLTEIKYYGEESEFVMKLTILTEEYKNREEIPERMKL
jgi:hypothetical protein